MPLVTSPSRETDNFSHRRLSSAAPSVRIYARLYAVPVHATLQPFHWGTQLPVSLSPITSHLPVTSSAPSNPPTLDDPPSLKCSTRSGGVYPARRLRGGVLDFGESGKHAGSVCFRLSLVSTPCCHERTPTGVQTCREGRMKKLSPAGRLTT